VQSAGCHIPSPCRPIPTSPCPLFRCQMQGAHLAPCRSRLIFPVNHYSKHYIQDSKSCCPEKQAISPQEESNYAKDELKQSQPEHFIQAEAAGADEGETIKYQGKCNGAGEKNGTASAEIGEQDDPPGNHGYQEVKKNSPEYLCPGFLSFAFALREVKNKARMIETRRTTVPSIIRERDRLVVYKKEGIQQVEPKIEVEYYQNRPGR